MKYFIPLMSAALLLWGCGPASKGDAIPQDLEGKRQLLKEKREEMRQLAALVEQLEAEIAEKDSSQDKRSIVTVDTLAISRFQHFVEMQGTVNADESVAASSETGGRLIKMTVKEGDAVRQGQLIAKVDLEQINKQIAELETSLSLAKVVFEKQERLWKQRIGSEIQYLEAKNNKERLEKSLETLRYQLTKADVYAPATGVVDMVLVEAGEVAAPGAPIVMILNTSKLKVVAAVPEIYLGKIKRGEEVRVLFPAIGEELTARVSLIGRTINPANRTFDVEISLPSKGDMLKPNLVATVLFQDYENAQAIVLPQELIMQEVSGRDYVFVRAEGDKGDFAKKEYITVGRNYQGQVEVQEGLKPGDMVIIKGTRTLSENQLINIQNEDTNG